MMGNYHSYRDQNVWHVVKLNSYGLLRGSFRPTKKILPLRAYVRQRSRLFEKGAQEVLLMQKALTQMNVRLNMVISDITGLTGMKIIKAIIDGERNPNLLASLLVKANCRWYHW